MTVGELKKILSDLPEDMRVVIDDYDTALYKEPNIIVDTIDNNDDDKTGGFRNFCSIKGSKAIDNLADFVAIVSRPTAEESKQIARFSKSFNFTSN